MISRLGPMAGTVVVTVSPPGPSAQMAIAEAAGPCPEDTAFCRERNPPMPTSGDNGPTRKKKRGEKAPLLPPPPAPVEGGPAAVARTPAGRARQRGEPLRLPIRAGLAPVPTSSDDVKKKKQQTAHKQNHAVVSCCTQPT